MLKNSRGNAMIEIIPVLAIFILIVNFSLGFFGVIHSGILNSIAARNYAFETFRNRAELRYLRDDGSDTSFTYAEADLRFHAVIRNGGGQDFNATRRPIEFSKINAFDDSGDEELGLAERQKLKNIKEGEWASDAVEEGTNNPWIRTIYGICLSAKCGG